MYLVHNLHDFVFKMHFKQTRHKMACSGSTLFGFIIIFETNQNFVQNLHFIVFFNTLDPGPSWLVHNLHYLFLNAFETHQKQGGLFRICTILFSYYIRNKPEPKWTVFYGDLVYEFKRIVGKPNFSD